MTTTVTTAQTGPLTANGVTPLPFTFQSISIAEIGVTRNGVVQVGGYTVTRNADGTGSVTPTTSWGSDTIIIYSAPTYQQPTGFNKFGAFYPDQFNAPIDRIARSVLALKSSTVSLPPGTSRINKIAGWDAGGNPTSYPSSGITGTPGPTGDGVSTFSALAGVNGADGDAAFLTEGLRGGTFVYRAGNYTSLVTADPLQGIYVATTADPTGALGAWVRQVDEDIKPQWYGTLGNGTTDDTATLQAAIDANPGKAILLTKGSYRITVSIKINSRVTLDFEPGATLLLATQNMNGIEIGNGTEAVRNATFGTVINNPSFNPAAGVAASTTGSCLYRNYVAFCDVNNMQVFGRDGVTTKLFNGVYDYRATECDTQNMVVQYVLNNGVHCKGDGTTPGRTVDCNYDNARITDVGANGIFIDEGCAGLGFYRPIVYGVGAGGWGIRMNCTPGPNGQNFFIDTPDMEKGIFLERGQKAMVHGGWIGASMGLGLHIGAGADGCDVSCSFTQSKVLIEGSHNTISGGEIVGDSATAGADGLTIAGANTTIAAGVKIRQWLGNGIAWGAVKPTGVLIGALNYTNNGTDIAPVTGFTLANGPVIAQGNTDKGRTGTAAATLALPITVPFMQVTGATAITTIPLRGVGSRVTLQAGTGGISLATGGNLILPATPLAITAFNTVSLLSDGSNWFFDGKSF